jgi:hypothetical protein
LLLQVITIRLGLLLVAGVWTPVVAAVAAIDPFLTAFSHPVSARYWLGAMVGVARALRGSDIWSIDAKLFGWNESRSVMGTAKRGLSSRQVQCVPVYQGWLSASSSVNSIHSHGSGATSARNLQEDKED